MRAADGTAAVMQTRWMTRGRALTLALVAAGVALLFAANAHFVYLALSSQPECVAHARTGDAAGVYAAAKSAC